ncbi:MAG TPA: DoxX family protein [Pyrinomonadaceae bacterium]
MTTLPLESMDRYRDYSAVFIRLLVGPFIIWGVQDNILSWEQMLEFRDFLAERGVAFPLFAACLSVYTQFICGLSILLGAFVRLTSIPFIINFAAALLIAHRGDAFRAMFPALMMLAIGFFFLFHGAGKLSVDERLGKRKRG